MAELKDMVEPTEAEMPRSSDSTLGAPVTNVDAAWKFLDANRELDGVEATPDELRALRRKIDWHIVPIMFCCYTMQFLDKVILNVSQPQSLPRRAYPSA